MCCKQAELRPDLSYNSSRNRSRPTLPCNPPHTHAWGEQWAAGHSPQLLRAQRRERDRREGCWVGEGEWKQGGGWQHVPGISAESVRETLRLMGREGPQEQIWIYESFKRKVCVRKIKVYVLLKSMRSIGSGSSASIHTVSWIKPPTPLCRSSRLAILHVKEIQLDELYPNYYWLISVVRRFAGGKILRHSYPRGPGSSKPVLWIIKSWQNSNGPFWNSCLISALNRAAEVFP